MDNFDLRKYLAEGRLLKENIDFPELEDEFEGAMDAMVVEPEVYLQDIIDASADEIVSDSYYEIMNAVEQGIYSKDEAVKLAKSWAKEKLSTLAEGKLLKEEEVDVLGNEFLQDIQDTMKMSYKMDVDMDDIKDWVKFYYIDYNSEYDEGPGDVDYEGNEFGSEDYESEKKELVFDTAEREDFLTYLEDEELAESVVKITKK